MKEKRRSRRGRSSVAFTLIELLVVITIIGILIGMLLPAVQSVRQAASRIRCTNNMKQIALALASYCAENNTFPAGAILAPPYPGYREDYDPWNEAASKQTGKHGTSWMLAILPFLEQKALYMQWDFTKSVLENKAVASVDINTFYCPSRRAGVRKGDTQIMFQKWTSGGTDYGGCMGQQDEFENTCATNSVSHELCGGQWLFDTANHGLQKGIFLPNVRTRTQDIIHGTSNTIMIAELQRLIPPAEVPRGQNPEYYGPCMTSNDGWALGGLATAFDTNTPQGNGDLGQPGGFNNKFFESAGSQHPGGANFATADGSVHFLSEIMDSTLYANLGCTTDVNIAVIPP